MTQPPGPCWSDPKAAFAEYRPGLSPYLHYFQEARRGTGGPQPDLGPDAGSDLPWQMEKALRHLIEESLG